MAPRRAAALAALAALLLAALPAALATAGPKCVLALAPAELDSLGRVLAEDPDHYLVMSGGGQVKGVKTEALRGDGFSEDAVK